MLSKILSFFYDISRIPHPTYKEEKIANYVYNVAKNLNLKCFKDKYNNVYIKKTVDKNKPYVILHSHLDMVCVKDSGYNIDFEKDGLKLINKNNYLKAYKTSLGADNGIGVAIILALLTYENYNMEAIFTTDEECTTTGAINFDYSKVSGNNLISLDGFKLNEIIVGCASVCDMKIKLNNTFYPCNEKGFSVSICGLKGGHSGGDIHRKVGNSIKISNKILSCFSNIKLSTFTAGNQFNFIPNEAKIEFTGKKLEYLEKTINELKQLYPTIKIAIKDITIKKSLSMEQSKNILDILDSLPTGVINSKGKLIELSQNLSCVNLQNDEIKINQRGTNQALENNNIKNISSLCKKFNFNFSIYDKLGGFETNKNSVLVKELCKTSLETNNIKLKKVVKHISLECSIFQEKLPLCNIVAISPKIEYAHSTNERVYLPSVTQCYKLITNYLAKSL